MAARPRCPVERRRSGLVALELVELIQERRMWQPSKPSRLPSVVERIGEARFTLTASGSTGESTDLSVVPQEGILECPR